MDLKRFFLTMFVAAGLAAPCWGQEGLNPEVEGYLKQQNVQFAEGDLLLQAKLVSIIVSSNRMVVKSDKDGKTLVLPLNEKLVIRRGSDRIEAKDLKHGDALLVILGKEKMEVKQIHRYPL